ncbi:MAG: hypothetical protein R3B70_42235 [Polyangiaceae bacterium]
MKAKRAVLGIVENHAQAGNIVATLRLQGFPNTWLSVLFLDEANTAGGSAGPGGALGFFGNLAHLDLPRLGHVAVAGSLSSLLCGAEAAGEAADLAATLMDFGASVLEARQCERDVASGGILMLVHIVDYRLQGLVKKAFHAFGGVTIDAADITKPVIRRAA